MANSHPSLDERAFALSCELLKLLIVHGIRPELASALSDKQKEGTFAFRCQVIARNIARAHVKGWNADVEYQSHKGGAS